MDAARIVCPEHGIPDCSPMLNGCSIVNRLHAERAPQQEQQAIIVGTETALVDDTTWRPEELARFQVANVHHPYATARDGMACLCGAKTRTHRATTEHIIDEYVAALAAWPSTGGAR